MARVVADGDNMRVMPLISQGSASNLEDLLYLRGVDVAVTQSDVFEFFRTERATPNLDKRVHYIFRFPPSETHIVAKKEIRSIEDLRGKKVHFGSDGASGTLTGRSCSSGSACRSSRSRGPWITHRHAQGCHRRDRRGSCAYQQAGLVRHEDTGEFGSAPGADPVFQ